MSTTSPCTAARAVLVGAALAMLPGAAARAAPEVTPETAQDALVDLGTLWTKATNERPLEATVIDRYLTPAAAPVLSAGSRPPPAPLFDVGFSLELEVPPDPPRPTSSGGARLPIIPVSAADARELYRRQAYLSVYLRKHAAVQEVLTSGLVSLSARMPEEDVARHRGQAAAAHVELFLIERIAFGEGETQAEKCAAFQRAVTHARALGLEPSGAGRAPLALAESELPAGWRALYAKARRHHTDQHARFPAALCAEGSVVTRAETRGALEQLLTERLKQRVQTYFSQRTEELKAVQRAFTQQIRANETPVPRREIVEMRKRTADARSTYQQIIVEDMFGLKSRLATLASKTDALSALLADGQTARGTFAVPEAELARLRGELSRLLSLARSLGDIRFPGASEQAALAPCARVPATFPPVGSGGPDVVAAVDACLASAQALRDRLIRTPTVSSERDRFLRDLQSLSNVYLTVNSW